MQRTELEKSVEDALPGARCQARDLTGTADHWDLRVVWQGFASLDRLARHRAVLEILRPYMEGGSGAIHAVQIQTLLPES